MVYRAHSFFEAYSFWIRKLVWVVWLGPDSIKARRMNALSRPWSRWTNLNQQIKDYLTEQIRQLQFSPFHLFIARLKAVTLLNSFRFFGNEFQIWLPLKDIVSEPFFVVKTAISWNRPRRMKQCFLVLKM